jgi:ubiquinone/menaquinone biosynthesis C-methylase UbiE
MTKARVIETNEGIQDPITVAQYDLMQRHLRDCNWIETNSLLEKGWVKGHALEIGHGPGYLGLEWLKRTENTTLTAVDISPAMTTLACKNAQEYQLSERVQYDSVDACRLPYADNTFDLVFSNGSLHEWEFPLANMQEMLRVLKPGGHYQISDLRRDIAGLVHWFLKINTQPAQIRPYLDSSIQAAYTPDEARELTVQAGLLNAVIKADLFGLQVYGEKPINCLDNCVGM